MTTDEQKLQRSIDDICKCARRHWLDETAHSICMEAVRKLTKIKLARSEKKKP